MKTKTLLIVILLSFVAMPCMAQHKGDRERVADPKSHREITEMVSDLSQSQKKRLDAITDAQLQRDISREMYTTKVRVDEVLTPEQRRQLREAMAKTSKVTPKKKHR